MFGKLIPQGGGDPIPLMKKKLLIGRRESCAVVLRFSNVSAPHSLLVIEHGYWFAKDLNSRNGTRVNGSRIERKRRDPGCILRIAKHIYEVDYSPTELGAQGPPPPDEEVYGQILNRSLLDRAGLTSRETQQRSTRPTAISQDDLTDSK